MKKRVWLLVLLSIVVAASCTKEKGTTYRKSVLIYFAANNGLSGNASENISQLAKGVLPPTGSKENVLLVYLRDYVKNPVLMKMSRDEDGSVRKSILFKYPSDQNSATAEALARVLHDADALCPAEEHGLILWSHSSGWLPEGYMNNYSLYERDPNDNELMAARGARLTSFGQDYTDKEKEIEIQDLAEALPLHYDYIIFDSCLMGCVEVACELKDKCDLLAFSPAEIVSKGFPYEVMMEHLLGKKGTEEALTEVCRAFYEYYRDEYESNPWNSGCTVSIVRTSRIDALAREFGKIAANHREEIFKLEEDNLQRYFRYGRHWFFDLDDIVQRVADESELESFRKALGEAVIYKAATGGFMLGKDGFLIEHYCGLSSYKPLTYAEYLNSYYKNLKWNKATGLVN